MTDVAPPATDEWWDTVLTKAAVLHQLRLREGDVDEDRVEALIPVAGQLINVYLDRPAVSPGWPVPAHVAAGIREGDDPAVPRQDAPGDATTGVHPGHARLRGGRPARPRWPPSSPA